MDGNPVLREQLPSGSISAVDPGPGGGGDLVNPISTTTSQSDPFVWRTYPRHAVIRSDPAFACQDECVSGAECADPNSLFTLNVIPLVCQQRGN